MTVTTPPTVRDRVVGARAGEDAPCRCPPSSGHDAADDRDRARVDAAGEHVGLQLVQAVDQLDGAAGRGGFGARSCTFSQRVAVEDVVAAAAFDDVAAGAAQDDVAARANDVAPAGSSAASPSIRAMPAALRTCPLATPVSPSSARSAATRSSPRSDVVEVRIPTGPRRGRSGRGFSLSGALTAVAPVISMSASTGTVSPR